MNILTVENKTFNLDNVPNEIEDIRYCVLDCNNPSYVDYFFVPLVFLEVFYAPSVVLKIGHYRTQMPLDWSVVVCDEEMNEVEVMPLTSLNERGFKSFAFNPYSDAIPNAYDIEITNVYADVKWFFPKLKSGTILCVPLENKEKPKCALFVKEANKVSNIDLSDIFGG